MRDEIMPKLLFSLKKEGRGVNELHSVPCDSKVQILISHVFQSPFFPHNYLIPADAVKTWEEGEK